MVKLFFPLFLLLLLFSCQTEQFSKEQFEACDEVGIKYINQLYKKYLACEDSFENGKKWQPEGISKPIEFKNSLLVKIPCLCIIQPLFKYKSWITNNPNFGKHFFRSNTGIQIALMEVKIAVELAMHFEFVSQLSMLFNNTHYIHTNGAMDILKRIPKNESLKKDFSANLELLLTGINSIKTDSNSQLKVIVPEAFYPYYNTKVIDKKWLLAIFEKSGKYRTWLKSCKPFFDEVNKILPNEFSFNYFYECYHSNQIDSNFTVYKFSQTLK